MSTDGDWILAIGKEKIVGGCHKVGILGWKYFKTQLFSIKKAALFILSRYCIIYTMIKKETRRMKYPVTMLIVWMIGLSACRMDKPIDPIIVADVEREFTVDMLEILDMEGNYLTLQVATIREEDCMNAEIDYRVTQSGQKIGVSLNKIVIPVNCQEGKAPARAGINLGKLTIGNFDFALDLSQTISNKGTLVNGASSYRLQLKTENGIQLLHRELLKIPEQTIWGWISYAESTQSTAAAVLRDLSQLSSERVFEQGYYGHFSLSGDQLNIRELPSKQLFLPVLIHLKKESTDQLQAILQHYRSLYTGEQLSIHLTNWRGQSL